MSSLRQNPLTGRWVILAAERQKRPNEFSQEGRSAQREGPCPFCPGNEHLTTPEILATGRHGASGADISEWKIRVFGNMYPALTGPTARPFEFPAEPFFQELPAGGVHEVVAYTPDHGGSLATLAEDHLADFLKVVRDRIATLQQEHPLVQHVLPFGNHGPRAGATLSHPHWQILASPLVPAAIVEKSARLEAFRREQGECLVCHILNQEAGAGDRLIIQNSDGICLAPWASRFPFEMMIIPRRHSGRFETTGEGDWPGLARLLKSAVARLEKIHENLSYNVILHSAGKRESDFHWHLEILPRLTTWAGFEVGSGHAINSITPEDAAAQLRKAD